MQKNRHHRPTSIPLITLYKSQDDMKRALIETIDMLTGQSKISQPPKKKDEFFSIVEITEALIKNFPELSYINTNHIVELFFKDRDRKILINGEDNIKYKEVRYVQPPNKLYFGTVKALVERMQSYGLKSMTKGYIKLYKSREQAIEFGKKFANWEGDEVVALAIDSEKAFSEGMKFSTYQEGEFIIVRVDRKYIKGIVED